MCVDQLNSTKSQFYSKYKCQSLCRYKKWDNLKLKLWCWTCMCQEYELCFTCPWQTLKQWFTYITIHISWFASDIINYSNLLRTNYLRHISRPISKSPQVIHQRDIGMYNKLSREFKCLRCVYTCIPHIPKAVKRRFPKPISSADIH